MPALILLSLRRPKFEKLYGEWFKRRQRRKMAACSAYKWVCKSSRQYAYGEYVAWQRACLIEMLRLLPEHGAIFYNHKWRVQDGLLQDRHDIVGQFPVRQIIIWRRKGGINFNAGYFLPTYEVIYL